ncbi:MAG: DUF2160 domain-containing protein [Halieaceae bacterium]|jgi:predicted small integral membrane protein|nr:DUF2160 domain-containing protein [Halieaceae bacterium]
MDLSWMAWTTPTALFFVVIACLVMGMGIWEFFRPGGQVRRGLLGISTTRGDRLFISLLGSGYICLAWLGILTISPEWSLLACLAFSVLVFRYC